MTSDWQYPIRIVSDLHLGHRLALVKEAGQLAPLFSGAGTVLFNGDTVEPFLSHGGPSSSAWLEALRVEAARVGAMAVFVNGNHDPGVGVADTVDLLGGAVFVTHGDVFFEDVAPWSLDADFMREQRRAALERHPGVSRRDLEAHMGASRAAVLALHEERRRRWGGVGRRVRGVLRLPLTLLYVWRSWRQAPGLARRFAKQFRPRARFIVFGHIHRPGVWRVGRRIAVNTGAFQRWFSQTVVDVEASGLTVRAVDREPGGLFGAGRVIERFDLSRYPALETVS